MKRKTLKRRKHPKRLFKIVDKVLKQVLGEPTTLFLYKHLEEEHSLKPEDIPNELKIFEKGLEEYLSGSGASAVLGVIQSESPELKMKILSARNAIYLI
jgi:hypothetical protein